MELEKILFTRENTLILFYFAKVLYSAIEFKEFRGFNYVWFYLFKRKTQTRKKDTEQCYQNNFSGNLKFE
ncbi:unnamed protein product [Rhizophagus irregularis]|uniref:Uncharacterized protein n=1 Tax=Rhizophagus irregularis TaxID=588596 RepID=A0A915Z013_9GLOM|nr:unnamed protein product [Rhizophagus irregularis]CAB5356318.1 unnamed protein product [Rhizophagus irregularis]